MQIKVDVVFAQLCQFYHIDPPTLLLLPQWQINILLKYMPAIGAREQEKNCRSSSFPHSTQEDRSKYSNKLRELSQRLESHPSSHLPPPPQESNPQKAKEWFEARGIKVSSAN